MKRIFYILVICILGILAKGCGGNSLLEKKLMVSEGFKASYKFMTIESFPMGGTDRKSIKIFVPIGLTREELKDNLIACTKEYFLRYNPDALMVTAYRKGSNIKYMYDAAQSVFAPNGEWSSAERGTSLDVFEFKMDISNQYFKIPPKLLVIGTPIILYRKNSGKIRISTSASSWEEGFLKWSVPSGTPAVIESVFYEQNIEFVRYSVKFKYNGKEHIGWIHKSDIKEPN